MKNDASERLLSILEYNCTLAPKDRDTINMIYATLISEGHIIFFRYLLESIRNFERHHKLVNFFKYRACDFFFEISEKDGRNEVTFFDNYTEQYVGRLVGVCVKLYLDPKGLYMLDDERKKIYLLALALNGETYFLYDEYNKSHLNFTMENVE
jgi:hypothetical protein